ALPWRCSAPRRRSTAAMRSFDAAATHGSFAILSTRPAANACAFGSPAASSERWPRATARTRRTRRTERSPEANRCGDPAHRRDRAPGWSGWGSRWYARRATKSTAGCSAERWMTQDQMATDEATRSNGRSDVALDQLSFDDAFAELQRVVAELEAGGQ